MKLRYLLLRRKAMSHIDSILKTRDIKKNKKNKNQRYQFATIVKAMLFPVVMYVVRVEL